MNDLPLVRPGMIVGILGGGQLGRMLALAAAELGLSCHIYCPDPKSPAFAVSAARTVAPYDDEAALAAFAAAVDVVTYEFENVPVATADFLAERVAVLPEPAFARGRAGSAVREGPDGRARPAGGRLRRGRPPGRHLFGACQDRPAGDPEDAAPRL